MLARAFGGRDIPKRILVPVHFASNDRKQRFAVYNDLDVVLLYHFIKLCRTVYIFKVIGQASTALVADSYADELRRRTAHQDLQTLHGLGGLHIEQKKG